MSHQAFSPLDESHMSTCLKNQDKSQLDTAQEPLVDPRFLMKFISGIRYSGRHPQKF